MSRIFLHLLNVSITAGWIVLVVVLLRLVLRRAPKWIRVAAWGLVALRLLLPVTVESILSLVPSAETVQIEAVKSEPASVPANVEEASFSQSVSRVEGERIVIRTGLPAVNRLINQPAEKAAEHVDTVAVLKTVAGWVWLGGAIAMLLYALISYLRLRLRVRASIKVEKGIYVCDGIRDPFILGFIFPRIYLPSGMDETTKAYVLSHERAHLKRFDHIWKPLGFLLLAVYWFNPLLWLAYILLCRDIELACDEKVVKEYDAENKAAYSEALLKSSVSRRSIAACPLAFGEVGVKSRVKSILNYKKPTFWIILVAILACIAVAVCFLTVPKHRKIAISENDRNLILQAQLIEDSSNNYQDPTSHHPILTNCGMFHCVMSDEACLAFRTVDGREICLLDGFAGNIQYHNPYVYATIGNGTWKDLPSLYRVDLRDGSVEKFAVKVQIEYVYEDGCVLWWSPDSETWYISDWNDSNRKTVLHSRATAFIPTPEGVYLYGDGDIFFYERNHEIKKLYSFEKGNNYIEQCYYINNHYYVLLYGNYRNQRLVELNADGSITEICTIDIDAIRNNNAEQNSNASIRFFLLPNRALDALKKWTHRPIVYEQEVEPGVSLFGIVSDRIVRIYSYRDAVVYCNADSDYQEFVIPLSPISREEGFVSAGEVKEWLDYYSASSELPWEQYREIAIDAFPTVRFRWSSGSVEAVESGSSTRTLFQGMPVWNVYFTDVTGDGKPELLATVSFGSGVIDEHIVVYDYENRQSYTLWGRFKFDYHLYLADGKLLVGKIPYNGDKQVDYGTLVMHDGVLCCQWHGDGSFTSLNRELHESELYGYWLVEEETDNAGNVLYSKTLDLWKEYNFREDGTVIYNETVPISSNSELAFGHPVSYPYEVHDDFVYIAGEDTSGAFRFGQYDREIHRLTLMYNTDEQTRYAKLRRMGEDITDTPQTLREMLLGTYVCTTAERDGQTIPVPDEYAGMKIDLGDSYDLSYPNQTSEYFHVASATVGGVEKAGYDWTVDENDMLVVWNPETGDTMRFEWYPKVFGAETLRMLVPDSYNGDYYLIFTFTFDD